MTMIDKYSRHCQVYLLKNKSEATEVIKGYGKWAERLTGYKVKYFKTDHGGEYVNNELKKYFDQLQIVHTFTSVKCPASNGLAERRNRSLKDDARTIMQSANLPQHLRSPLDMPTTSTIVLCHLFIIRFPCSCSQVKFLV